MTDGNTYAINKHLDEREDYDALQEVTAELEQAESDMLAGLARIAELEADLEEQVEWVRSLAYDLVSAEGREARLKEKLAKVVLSLEKLARLGNGDHYGNSEGNMIARSTLAVLKGETE